MAKPTLNCLLAAFLESVKIILIALCVSRAIFAASNMWEYYLKQMDSEQLHTVSPSPPGFGIYIMGVSIMAICSMGAYGAYSKNPACLKLFSQLVVIHSGVSFSLGVNEKSRFKWNQFEKLMIDYAKDYQRFLPNGTEPHKATLVWDLLQRRGNCCGLYGPHDWTRGVLYKRHGYLPISCCSFASERCESDSDNLYHEGCLEDFRRDETKQFYLLITDCLMSLLLGLLGFVLALGTNHVPVAVDATVGVDSSVPAFAHNQLSNKCQEQPPVELEISPNPNKEPLPPPISIGLH